MTNVLLKYISCSIAHCSSPTFPPLEFLIFQQTIYLSIGVVSGAKIYSSKTSGRLNRPLTSSDRGRCLEMYRPTTRLRYTSSNAAWVYGKFQ